MRGLVILIGLIAFVAIGCVAIPFIVMPDAGIAAALPVIYVPGEHLETFDFMPFTVSNTILASWLTIIIVFLWILPIVARRKDVPGRGQALAELIIDAWYGLARQVAGSKGRQLVPLMLSIFFFLLVANLMKIFPGIDTVGEVHCAGLVPETVGEVEDYGEEYLKGLDEEELTPILAEYNADEVDDLSDEEIEHIAEVEYHDAQETAYISFSGYEINKDKVEGLVLLKNEEALNAGDKMPFEQYKGCSERLHAQHEEHAEESEDSSEEEAGGDTEESDSESEEAEDSEPEEAEDSESEEAEDSEDAAAAAQVSEDGDAGGEDTYPTANEDHGPEYDRYAVTPFLRGASTDLSLTLSIAIIAMFFVQVFGIKELGVTGWGVKFLNLPALEKGGIQVIDFGVGLLEIVLEFAKIVSFAFRLFGSMFAGQILMFVIVFLAATFVPMLVVGLEVFVGVIQAFIFAILFLMFTSVAMTPHHSEEHGEEHH